MTLKELLDKVSELCNDETKDLPVTLATSEGTVNAYEIYHHRIMNDYLKIDEIRIS